MRPLPLGQRTLIMGVLNVTPDSFSDGGLFFDPDTAVQQALALAADGADIIDVGGESTRPGAAPVGIQSELDRVLPVIGAIRVHSSVAISVDTWKPEVAEAALQAGADIINTTRGVPLDPALATLARRYDAGLVLMHMRGTPATMQSNTDYDDVVTEVCATLAQSARAATEFGLASDHI